MLAYRLDELGWVQFEELCQALLKAALGMGIQAWGGSGDFGRDAYYGDALPFPLGTDWGPSDIDEYNSAAEYAKEMAGVLDWLAEHFPTHAPILTEVSCEARERGRSFEARVEAVEAEAEEYARDELWDEPNEPANNVPEFSILAVMRDL